LILPEFFSSAGYVSCVSERSWTAFALRVCQRARAAVAAHSLCYIFLFLFPRFEVDFTNARFDFEAHFISAGSALFELGWFCFHNSKF